MALDVFLLIEFRCSSPLSSLLQTRRVRRLDAGIVSNVQPCFVSGNAQMYRVTLKCIGYVRHASCNGMLAKTCKTCVVKRHAC